MEDYLNFKLSKLRVVTVNDIKSIPVTIPNKGITLNKVTFFVNDQNNREFVISDVWVNRTSQNPIKGLFLATADTDTITSGSPLGKLMQFYDKKQLKDFLHTEVQVYPDKKDYLVLVACKFIDQETDNEMQHKHIPRIK
ncbi:MAG TPA: hypothetical protein PKN48_00560 [Bacteroidales bacterium]|nr:hypothetical protein [Bacteroidales bacterium]